ncbi:MAG: hypothetical protein D3923_17225, partial [Candidatus Electrothrix sp. AR3]|nr:hypothetical protein [Candidatus Electrothrix sp. AR3]
MRAATLSSVGNLAILLLCCQILLRVWPSPAQATEGHVFAKGIVFNAATYLYHSKYGTHSSYYGNRPEQVVDINIGILSSDDEGIPLFAPEDGRITPIH